MVWRFDQQALRIHMHCMLQSRSQRFPGLFLLTDIQQLHSHLSWRDDNSGWKTTNLAALNPKSCPLFGLVCKAAPQDLEVCAECALAFWNKIPVATRKDCQDSSGRTCRCPPVLVSASICYLPSSCNAFSGIVITLFRDVFSRFPPLATLWTCRSKARSMPKYAQSSKWVEVLKRKYPVFPNMLLTTSSYD